MLNCHSGRPERQGALPLSYGRTTRPAGFEPATTRLKAEVSDIFTTDRAANLSAGEHSRPYCLRRGVLRSTTELRGLLRPTEGFEPPTSRSNGTLHHRQTGARSPRAGVSRGTFGNGLAFRPSGTTMQPRPSPPGTGSRGRCGKANIKHPSRRSFGMARRRASPSARPAIGGPRDSLAHRSLRRAPRFRPMLRSWDPGLPYGSSPGISRRGRCGGGNEKPLRSGGSGGVRERRERVGSGQPEPLP